MKKLDWYIIKKFLGTFFFTIILFAAVAVVIDFVEKIDNFYDENIPFGEIVVEYYLNFIPFICLMLSPLFIFIAIIFFTSKLAYRSEIIAMMSGGVSFYRILFVPYFVAASLLVGLQLWANHYWVPQSNADRIAFEDQYINKRKTIRDRDIHMQLDREHYIYLESYNMKENVGRGFTLERFKDREIVFKMYADRIAWKEDKWEFKNYYQRTIKGDDEAIRKGTKLDTTLNLKPSDFGDVVRFKEAMTTPELKRFIEKEKLKGSSFVPFYEVEYHKRNSLPFATFFLTIIGFSMGSRKVRGGTGIHLFLGIAMSAAYVVFFQFSQTFSTQGSLPPFLGAWIPNIIFGVLSIILMLKAQK